MHLPRRRFLSLTGVGAVFAAMAKTARAQSYPVRPIHLIVGFPAGGPNDILARLIGQWLSGRLGKPVIVENQPGGSGNIATEAVVRAPADGYTLLLAGPANAINASVPAQTVAELIACAKANPARLRMASAGSGSSPHMSGLLFEMMTGIDLAVVHYAGGGPALQDMIEGQAQIMFEPMSASLGPAINGRGNAEVGQGDQGLQPQAMKGRMK
jgi:tripartite-type tricarboxylate transporter receptor subunit TctC